MKHKPRKRLTCADLPKEWSTPGWFYAPVIAWRQLQHVPQDWNSEPYKVSQRATNARDRDLQSDDARTRQRASGNLGALGKWGGNREAVAVKQSHHWRTK